MKTIRLRLIAFFLLFIFTADLFIPTALFALTSGPSQPEFQGFTEVDISQSVDPFTGDFSYQIPLMTVPGPNGGYPLNLTYSSGVGIEEEASWVGLGWSLTPGSINRSVRGLPDDFRGQIDDNSSSDYVKHTKFMKPNFTAMIGASAAFKFSLETYGADIDLGASINPNVNYYYNSYQGFGFKYGLSLGLNPGETSDGSSLSGAINLSFDAADGPSIQPSLSFGVNENNRNVNFSVGMGYSSRQGIMGSNFSNSTGLSKKFVKNGVSKNKSISNSGASISYGVQSGLPTISIPTRGFNAGFQMDFEAGGSGNHTDIPISLSGNFSIGKTADYIQDGYSFPAFGTMYSEHRLNNDFITNDRALMDFNMENEGPINNKTPILAMTVATHDIYQVSGDGLGGTFRPFRNDAGIFYSPKVVNVNVGVNLGFEIAAAPGFKFGIDPNVTFSRSYSGKWRNNDEAVMHMMGFKDAIFFKKNGVIRNEPFTFRFPNEFLPNFEGEQSFKDKGGLGPVMVDIHNTDDSFDDFSNLSEEADDEEAGKQMKKNNFFKDLLIFKAKASPSLSGTAYSPNSFINKEPRRRSNLIQYYTFSEATAFKYPSISNIYTGSYSNPKAMTFTSLTSFPGSKSHHVKGFDILKPDGSRFVYDLPLYNHVQKEIFFAVQGEYYYQNGLSQHPPKVGNAPLSVINTKKGEAGTSDRFYSESETGPYAHTYLLSYVTSPDYVDVDYNGPSENDMGYWAKFNYYKPDSGDKYKWRMPFEIDKANLSSGMHSYKEDGKASIIYGEKDVTYLHSIETKTHIAIFTLSERGDAIGVSDIYGGATNGKKSQKLDKIELFSKNDLSIALKTVHFVYEVSANELCKNIPNRDISISNGKLTLKEIYFTYKSSSKGSQMKYKFEYGDIYTDDPNTGYLVDNYKVNKNYAEAKTDRWGTYSENMDPDNPYTNQDRNSAGIQERKEAAVTWNLTKINLPTGAVIRIDYEMDDYSHVQNTPASQMVKIIGTGRYDNNNNLSADWLDDGAADIKKNDRIVFFEPLEEIPISLSHAEKMQKIEKYVSGLEDGLVFFKVWERLQPKNNLGPWMADYVPGYGKLKMINGKPKVGYTYKNVGVQNICIPFVEFDEAENASKNHFRSAGLQYLRYLRSDLNKAEYTGVPVPDPGVIIMGLFQVIPQITELIAGYYNSSILKGYCGQILSNKPSYLRLSTPDGKKFGGGSRVRKLTVSDEWTVSGQTSTQYGTEYYYKTTDGASSGVAIYEPILGNDENSMKKPYFYGPDNKFSHNDKAYFMEAPIGESYFPSPSVGYRRVVMNNLANNKVKQTGDGIQVKEFYTALEFPMKVEFNKQPQRVEDKFNYLIPLIGSITMKAYGYSQGFFVELNDMHGKPKAEYLFDRDFWDNAAKELKPGAIAIGSTYNKYQTINNYVPNGPNSLDSEISVIDKHGLVKKRIVGDVSEFFGSMAENYNYSITAGAAVNVGVDPLPYVIFGTIFPHISYDEVSARVITTTKIVNKVGVLCEVTTLKDGVTQIAKNIYYDEETAQPVLTAITDDYDDPMQHNNDRLIYTMQYPAHWYYSGMQPAYKNYRLRFNGDLNNVPNAHEFFEKGDEIWDGATRTFVIDVSNNSVSRVNSGGAPVTNNFGSFVITRSGKRNIQSASAGKIVSLNNPSKIYSVLYWGQIFKEKFEELILNNPSIAQQSLANYLNTPLGLGYVEFCDGNIYYPGITFGTSGWYFALYQNPGLSSVKCGVSYYVNDFDKDASLSELVFNISGSQALTFQIGDTSEVIVQSRKGEFCPNLFQTCMEGVLQAEATEYSDAWNYRKEFYDIFLNFYNGSNAYVKGEKGIWRMKRANAYFTERKQFGIDSLNQFGQTNIGNDGTFKVFVPFNWEYVNSNNTGNENNIQAVNGWRWMAEVPSNGYNPFGFEIENKNALGIYSAALYGYNNSLTTAVSQNASYHEIGYDGFEENPNGMATNSYLPQGHIQLNASEGTISLVSTTAHTGRYALSYPAVQNGYLYIDIPVYGSVSEFSTLEKLQFVKGKSYTVGFWYKLPNNQYWSAQIKNLATNTIVKNVILSMNQQHIEGWRRFEVSFTVPPSMSNGQQMRLILEPAYSNSNITIDDIRIQPTNSSLTSYVYDPIKYLLRAQLDDNNYATFYNYDEEDNLSQVKKETERGVMTIKQTRKNVKK